MSRRIPKEVSWTRKLECSRSSGNAEECRNGQKKIEEEEVTTAGIDRPTKGKPPVEKEKELKMVVKIKGVALAIPRVDQSRDLEQGHALPDGGAHPAQGKDRGVEVLAILKEDGRNKDLKGE